MRRLLLACACVLAACAPANSDTVVSLGAGEAEEKHLEAGEGWSENTVAGTGEPGDVTEVSSRPPIGPDEPWVALSVRVSYETAPDGAVRAGCEARVDAPPDEGLTAEGTVTTRLLLDGEVLREERHPLAVELPPGGSSGALPWNDPHEVGGLDDAPLFCDVRFEPR